MQYYEAYEDVLDEDYDDAYDDAFDDAYDDSYDEDSDGEDYGEARKTRSERIARRKGRRQTRRDRRNERRHGKPAAPLKPAATGDVKAAFNNVGQDLNKVNRDLQKEKARQANEQINELIALFLFRPKLNPVNTGQFVEVFDKDGKQVDKAGNSYTPTTAKASLASSEQLKVELIKYDLQDNLIPLIAVKLLSNMKGIDSTKGIERFLPLAAGFALSPSAQSMFQTKKDATGKSTGGLDVLNDLTNKPLLMLGLLLLVVNWGKLTKK
jgi:hypothetical protein